MTLPPAVMGPPTPRLSGRTVAVVLFYAAVTVWTVVGPGGLLGAMQEHAADAYGSGWFQLAAFIAQTPCTLTFLVGTMAVLPPPAGKRFLRWGLLVWVAVAALQVHLWHLVTSLPGGGC